MTDPGQRTLQPVRQARPGPDPEPTAAPGPRRPSPTIPEPRQARCFKPQLIESSRRTRRAGVPGPATRPADKTDITPYTNHIYAAKPRPRRKLGHAPDDGPARHMPPARRETKDDGVKQYLLDLAANEAARQIEEAALAAFPNSRPREGGVAHFYFHESSDSDNSAGNAPLPHQGHVHPGPGPKSSNPDLDWWHRHMQQHAQHLAQHLAQPVVDDAIQVDNRHSIMPSDSDLDNMDLSVPPNPLWTGSLGQPLGQPLTSLVQPGRFAIKHTIEPQAGLLPPPQADSEPEATRGPASLLPPDNPNRRGLDDGLGRPFGALGLLPEDPKLRIMRQAASPPMLGKDLTFRRCPSPKQTRLETDHPFLDKGRAKDRNRDVSGLGGLWMGYCCRSESNGGYIVPADLHAAHMIVTPQPSGTPRQSRLVLEPASEEPSPAAPSSDPPGPPPGLWTAEHRPRNGQPKGLHMLHGRDERLRREKAQAERDEKISREFDDTFVTQVYNYLSLGYPAMARCFDQELSKISHVSIEELARDDQKQMAKGHMLEEMNLDDMPDGARCPRWKALKTYIMEWARQHPDFDNLDPLAWGVRERRGSWAI